jgi:hypothetical protein
VGQRVCPTTTGFTAGPIICYWYRMFHQLHKSGLLLFVGLSLLALATAISFYTEHLSVLYAENGWVENIQGLFCLLSAGAIFFSNIFAKTHLVHKCFSVSFVSLFIILFSREIQSCNSSFLTDGICFPRSISTAIRATAGSAIVVSTIIFLLRVSQPIRLMLKAVPDNRMVTYFIFLVLFAVAAFIFEEMNRQSFEENYETLFMVYLALFAERFLTLWQAFEPADADFRR